LKPAVWAELSIPNLRLRTPDSGLFSQFMQLARVIGNIVSTVKDATLEGRKLLVIQVLDEKLRATGKPLVAVDSVGAGAGELVFWCRGKEASFPFEGSEIPTDCTIVGIVDSEDHVKSIATRTKP
jgi:microcompartment protein CcmK/EutM